MRGADLVLVVETDPLQADVLVVALSQAGFSMEVVDTGWEALARAASPPEPGLVLLEMGLPDLNGLEVIRRLRARSTVPIIIVTSPSKATDKVLALELGADDYITKPFDRHELLARIHAVRRRVTQGNGTESLRRGSRVLRVGALHVDVGRRCATRMGIKVSLTRREFDLVRALADAGGDAVKRQELIEAVWGAEYLEDERMLDVYIRRVRTKIEPDPKHPIYLHTIRGFGYRLAEERVRPAGRERQAERSTGVLVRLTA